MVEHAQFIFDRYELNQQTGEIAFFYQLFHEEKVLSFKEVLSFPQPFPKVDSQVLQPFLESVFLALGISYWKTYCPKAITIKPFSLTSKQAAFWNTFYTKGLGEFFYTNKIDFRGLVQFPFTEGKSLTPTPIKSGPTLLPQGHYVHGTVAQKGEGDQGKILLPLGGGKDAIVSAQLLQKSGKDLTPLTILTGVVQTAAQEQVLDVMEKKPLVVTRTLDPQLLELNKKKGVLNGHVPMVGMYSFISLLTAMLYDYDSVILSDEQSANYGNVEYLGETMNHQWSKSLEFEILLQEYIPSYMSKNIAYFSLLRGFSEIKVVQLFIKYPEYFPVFVSCNKGFAISKKGQTYWCGECPKCAFVFACLGAFLPKETVVGIFHKNLFEDKKLLSLYKELLGMEKFKPFECVGTPDEVKLAFYLASKKSEWGNAVIMQYFIKDVLPNIKNISALEKELFSLHENRIPDEFKEVLRITRNEIATFA